MRHWIRLCCHPSPISLLVLLSHLLFFPSLYFSVLRGNFLLHLTLERWSVGQSGQYLWKLKSPRKWVQEIRSVINSRHFSLLTLNHKLVFRWTSLQNKLSKAVHHVVSFTFWFLFLLIFHLRKKKFWKFLLGTTKSVILAIISVAVDFHLARVTSPKWFGKEALSLALGELNLPKDQWNVPIL